METFKPHIALLSSPGIGHLIPDLELARRLATHHHLTVTVFLVSSYSSSAENRVIDAAKNSNFFNLIELPLIDISCVIDTAAAAIVTQLAVMMRETLPALRSAISVLKPRPTVLIVDLFGTEAFSIADEFQMAKYVFIASHAWTLTLVVYLPIFDKEIEGQYVDQKEPLRIPGCEPVRPRDVMDPMMDRTDQQYREFVRIGSEIPLSDGVLVNTWEDLQGRPLAACRDENLLGRVVKSPVYTIGPVLRQFDLTRFKGELFDWLSKQPGESVIYISFGSGGTMSFKQMTELAFGLELSRQRFIWVVRPPPSTVKPDAAFFTTEDGNSTGNDAGDRPPASYLPEGFLARTSEVGLVVPMWAPQMEVLSHPSVGGFLTHCGWNSTLESLTNGIPMIAWPLYAEQRMNAALVVEELRVAVRPEAQPSEEVVGREEIAAMMKMLMVDEEGEAMRENAKQLKKSAEKALANGGSSHEDFSRLAKLFTQTH